MSEIAFQRWITSEEYLELERDSDQRHEYINGEIYAMAGGGIKHSEIATNLLRVISTHLLNRQCSAYGSDLRVHNPATGSYFYPGLMVLCGRPIFKGSGEDTVINPLVVIEILSPSTEKFDRNEKFMHYRALDSLELYVLVAQDEPTIEVHARQRKNEPWKVEVFQGLDSDFTLAPIEFTAPLSDVYRNVEFPTDKSNA